jgi:hypothetical protein
MDDFFNQRNNIWHNVTGIRKTSFYCSLNFKQPTLLKDMKLKTTNTAKVDEIRVPGETDS